MLTRISFDAYWIFSLPSTPHIFNHVNSHIIILNVFRDKRGVENHQILARQDMPSNVYIKIYSTYNLIFWSTFMCTLSSIYVLAITHLIYFHPLCNVFLLSFFALFARYIDWFCCCCCFYHFKRRIMKTNRFGSREWVRDENCNNNTSARPPTAAARWNEQTTEMNKKEPKNKRRVKSVCKAPQKKAFNERL